MDSGAAVHLKTHAAAAYEVNKKSTAPVIFSHEVAIETMIMKLTADRKLLVTEMRNMYYQQSHRQSMS